MGRTRAFLLVVGPAVAALLLYQADEFDPAAAPDNDNGWIDLVIPAHNNQILPVAERIGEGVLSGPEDLAYNPEEGFIYTGCSDGWIKRIRVSRSGQSVSVENWIHIEGGRPLGLAFGPDKQLVIADAYKGLLMVTREGVVQRLTNEAEGTKLGLTDGVDVAGNGVIYFTDASYKYKLEEHVFDVLEGRPYGRVMSFDASTNETRVLVRDLFFANGIALSPQHDFLVFCETPRRRCRKYHIQGEKKGLVDNFIDNLPGYPDNIHYDGESRFWIALTSGRTYLVDQLLGYRFLRKALAMWVRSFGLPQIQRGGGVLAVSLDGAPLELYTDPKLSGVSSGLKIGTHLYFGSIQKPHVLSLDLTEHAAEIRLIEDVGRRKVGLHAVRRAIYNLTKAVSSTAQA